MYCLFVRAFIAVLKLDGTLFGHFDLYNLL